MSTLATATFKGHEITVTRDEEPTVGNPAPFTSVQVDGLRMGEVMSSIRAGMLIVRLRLLNGKDTVLVTGTGGTFSEGLQDAAEDVIRYFYRQYPKSVSDGS